MQGFQAFLAQAAPIQPAAHLPGVYAGFENRLFVKKAKLAVYHAVFKKMSETYPNKIAPSYQVWVVQEPEQKYTTAIQFINNASELLDGIAFGINNLTAMKAQTESDALMIININKTDGPLNPVKRLLDDALIINLSKPDDHSLPKACKSLVNSIFAVDDFLKESQNLTVLDYGKQLIYNGLLKASSVYYYDLVHKLTHAVQAEQGLHTQQINAILTQLPAGTTNIAPAPPIPNMLPPSTPATQPPPTFDFWGGDDMPMPRSFN